MIGRIVSEAGRRVNVTRPLTHHSISPRRGLAMHATSAMERLLSRSEWRDGCLIYTAGTTQHSGHVLIGYQGGTVLVHRLIWILTNGPIPARLVVRHGCDVPRCINIEHLSLGTVADNNNDRDSRGRHVALKGELNGFARLTDAQAQEIKDRWLRGEETTKLAAEFNVGDVTICDIAKGRRWTHIETTVPVEERVTGRRGGHLWGDRTACKHGHPWTPENTYWRTRGGRQSRMCRECGRIKNRKP